MRANCTFPSCCARYSFCIKREPLQHQFVSTNCVSSWGHQPSPFFKTSLNITAQKLQSLGVFHITKSSETPLRLSWKFLMKRKKRKVKETLITALRSSVFSWTTTWPSSLFEAAYSWGIYKSTDVAEAPLSISKTRDINCHIKKWFGIVKTSILGKRRNLTPAVFIQLMYASLKGQYISQDIPIRLRSHPEMWHLQRRVGPRRKTKKAKDSRKFTL